MVLGNVAWPLLILGTYQCQALVSQHRRYLTISILMYGMAKYQVELDKGKNSFSECKIASQ